MSGSRKKGIISWWGKQSSSGRETEGGGVVRNSIWLFFLNKRVLISIKKVIRTEEDQSQEEEREGVVKERCTSIHPSFSDHQVKDSIVFKMKRERGEERGERKGRGRSTHETRLSDSIDEDDDVCCLRSQVVIISCIFKRPVLPAFNMSTTVIVFVLFSCWSPCVPHWDSHCMTFQSSHFLSSGSRRWCFFSVLMMKIMTIMMTSWRM